LSAGRRVESSKYLPAACVEHGEQATLGVRCLADPATKHIEGADPGDRQASACREAVRCGKPYTYADEGPRTKSDRDLTNGIPSTGCRRCSLDLGEQCG
jgi:hypothetical protein